MNIRKIGPVERPSGIQAGTVVFLVAIITNLIVEQNRSESLEFTMEMKGDGHPSKPLEGFVEGLHPPPDSDRE